MTTGPSPENPDRAWWEPDLASVFAGMSGEKLQASLRIVDRIAQVIETDGWWNDSTETRNAYRMARYWIASGKWDLVLVVLSLEGRTAAWPAHSVRWGREPFNDLGFPKTGLLSILSLKQAAIYAVHGGPDRWSPFPMQGTFLRASNWRSERSPTQNLGRHARRHETTHRLLSR